MAISEGELKIGRNCLIIGEYGMKNMHRVGYPIVTIWGRGKEPLYWNVENKME